MKWKILILWCSAVFGYSQALHYELIEDKNPLEILSPSLKDRKSVKVRLKNGLEAFLISDPSTHESAASLAVEIGCWHDPAEYPGMAHFCEHMVFMGSKKYPDENGFSKMVHDCGGYTNAYTKPDRTVYVFSSNNESFPQVLDVFAHFFIDPLFKKDALRRELLAVNQEFEKNVEHDGWREAMIFKETGNPNHPNAKFSTGTEETLRPITLDILASWFRKHYSSHRMHLVIYSNEPIDKLLSLLQSSFGNVQTTEVAELPIETLTSSTQKGHIIYIEPIKDLRRLTIAFEMPGDIARDLNGKPPELIGYALTHKGKNSLYQHLKQEGLCENITFDCDQYDKNSMMLNFTFELTKQGVTGIDLILASTFQAINHMKNIGIPSYLFNEAKKMAELDYQWQSKTAIIEYVMNAADEMVNEPLATFPYKTTTISAYKPASIAKTLSQMSPENASYFLTAPSKLTGRAADKLEKWMKAPYSIAAIDEEKLLQWRGSQNHPLLKSPEPNPFIPSEINLIDQGPSKEAFQPTLLADDLFGKCYYFQDQFYKVPQVVLLFGIKSPAINADVKSIVLTDLFSLHLDQSLSPLLSAGQRGGLATNIYQKEFKLNIAIHGYSEKTPLLLSHVLDAMKKSLPTQKEFNVYKENLLSQYENQSKNLPVYQAQQLMMSILYNNAPIGIDRRNTLIDLTLEDLVQYQEKLFNQIYVETIIAGNIEEEEASNIWKNAKTQLMATPYPVENQHKKEILLLSSASGPFTIEVDSQLHGNATLLMLQIGKSNFAKAASHKLLGKALSEAFFNTLRTKQQTGYITTSWAQEEVQELLYFFTVQSTTHYGQELLARFELFLEEFSREAEDLISKDRFEYLKSTLITSLAKPEQNLLSKTFELSSLAFTFDGAFFRRQEQIKAIEQLTYDEFIDDTRSFLSRQNTKRIAIIASGPPGGEKNFSYKGTTVSALKSLKN